MNTDKRGIVLKRAYSRGFSARMDNEKKEANPYKRDTMARAEWYRGYFQAEWRIAVADKHKAQSPEAVKGETE